MVRCPSCLNQNPPGTKNCTQCGNDIAHLEAAMEYPDTKEGLRAMGHEPPEDVVNPPQPAPQPQEGSPVSPKLFKKFTKEKDKLDKLLSKGKLDPALFMDKLKALKNRFQVPFGPDEEKK